MPIISSIEEYHKYYGAFIPDKPTEIHIKVFIEREKNGQECSRNTRSIKERDASQ